MAGGEGVSRYIDADALKMALYSIATADCGYTADVLTGLTIAKNVIDNAPTVDAVEVVRCRDCKHHRTLRDRDMCAKNADMLNGREVGLRATRADDFCSRGERRTDE